MGEWFHALRHLGGNPLWRYLARPPRRGWQRWWDGVQAVLLGGVLPVSLVASAVLTTRDIAAGRISSAGGGALGEVLSGAYILLFLFALLTLAVSLFLVTGDALSVLAAPGRRLSRQQLDDAVALTSLGPCEIVVAVLAANLRRLFWLILAVACFLAFLCFDWGAATSGVYLLNPVLALIGSMALAPLTALGLFITGMLAATLLILAMLALGRGVRSGTVLTAAGIGQVVALVLYLCSTPYVPLMTSLVMADLLSSGKQRYQYTFLAPSGGFYPALPTMLLAAALAGALLGLARWSATLRAIVAACWQLLAGIPFLFLALSDWPPSLFGMAILTYPPRVLKPDLLNAAQAWGLTMQLNFFAIPHGGALGLLTEDPLHIPYFEWWRWPLLIAAQLALIAFAAAQARLAVVLRFRGE